MNWGAIIGGVYSFGFAVTALTLTRVWYRNFGSNGSDFWAGPAWAMLGAAIWPLALPAFAFGIIAKWSA